MSEEAPGTIGLDGPVEPATEKCEGQSEGGVNVGIGAAEERDESNFDVGFVDFLESDGADPREEAHPVRADNEKEYGAKEPEGFLGELVTHDGGEEALQSFDDDFEEILEAAGDESDVARGELGDQDNGNRDKPHGDHRIVDLEKTDLNEHRSIRRQVSTQGG